MPFILTPDGPAVQTGEEILAEASAAAALLLGADFDATDLTTGEGQIFYVLAERELWQQGGMVDVVDALSIDRAQGRQLEAIGNSRGLPRLGASYGAVGATIYGDVGFDASNRQFKHLPSGTLWRSPAGSVIGGGGTVSVTLAAIDPVNVEIAAVGSDQWLVVQVTPKISNITNALPGTAGEPEEDLEVYRARLKASASSGTGTEPAILSGLLQVAGVTAETRVLVNRTLAVDVNGVPGKSVEAIVVGGSDEAVARMLWAKVSMWASFAGTTTIPANTYPGLTVEVKFTRPATVPLEAEVELTTTGAEVALPVDYVDQVQGAVDGFTWKIGQNPTAARLYNAVGTALPEDSYSAITAGYRLQGSADAFVANYAIGARARASIAAADVAVSTV